MPGRRSRRRPCSAFAAPPAASTSTCSPAPPASSATSRSPTSRRPASPSPGSTTSSAAAACSSSARARSGILERLDPAARVHGAPAALPARPAVRRWSPTGSTARPELVAEADRAGVPLLRTALSTAGRHRPPDDACSRTGWRRARRRHGVLRRHPRPGRAPHGGERHRQERVRARSRRPRPSARRRRHGRDPLPRRGRSSSAPARRSTRHHVEVRGLGLVNVTDLFGVSATRSSKRVELVVHLERWERRREYDRLGLDAETEEILGVRVPLVTMPVGPAGIWRCSSKWRRATSCCGRAAGMRRRLLAARLERRLERLGRVGEHERSRNASTRIVEADEL